LVFNYSTIPRNVRLLQLSHTILPIELEKQAKESGHLDRQYGVAQLQQSYFNTTVIDNPDSDGLVALQKLFYLAVKFPGLSPIIKWWTGRAHSNQLINKWLFNVTYAYRYSKTYRMPLWEVLRRAFLWKDNY